MPAAQGFDLTVLNLLVAAAEAGHRCPTNGEIGERTGMLSPSHASEIISRLERRGIITVFRGNCRRKVTIVETGKSTGGDIPAPHWRDRTADTRPPAAIKHNAIRHTVQAAAPARDENLAARIDADQGRLREQRMQWLEIERQRYGLPRRGRLIEEMPA